MNYDLISLGEPLLRLSPPGFEQLRRARTLNVVVAGSQFNVAANLARLGHCTALLTKLPDNALGQVVLDAGRACGVDVSHVKSLAGGKIGVTYVEFSAAPRAPLAVYDRAGSAASTIGPGDFDWEALVRDTRAAYTDGIFSGLSLSCQKATEAFLRAASRAKRTTIFDLNYREHLWTPVAARRVWSGLLPNVDVLVTNRSVSAQVFDFRGSDATLMRKYAREFGCSIICMTHREMRGLNRGAWSSQALTPEGLVRGKRYEFDIVDRYGTGDAWLAGFVHGLREKGARYGLDFGNAMCALAHTIEGDVAHVSAADVEAVMGGEVDLRVKR